MIMCTFVEAFDWTGKIILPFVTYAISGLGRTVDDYTRRCPGATITNGSRSWRGSPRRTRRRQRVAAKRRTPRQVITNRAARQV